MSILFKREFFAAIRSGAKTQTVRWWRADYAARFRAGQRMAVPFLPGGALWIESVQAIGPEDLCESDASAEGFDSLADLRARLAALYPAAAVRRRKSAQSGSDGLGSSDGRQLYRVRFRWRPCPP